MNTRTLFTTLLILAFPLFMLGCDSGGSINQAEDTGSFTFSIVNSENSGAAKNTIDRENIRDLEGGDYVNVLVFDPSGDVEASSYQLEVPNPGGTSTVTFNGIPTDQNYRVGLIGYAGQEGAPDPNGSVLLAASTEDNAVKVFPNQVTTVNFTTNDAEGQSDKFQRFDFSFTFPDQLTGEGENDITVNLDARGDNIAGEDEFIALGEEPAGTIEISSSESTQTFDFSGNENAPSLNALFQLSAEDFGTSTVDVLTTFEIQSRWEDEGQDLNVYNTENGVPEETELEGDGGIIIEF